MDENIISLNPNEKPNKQVSVNIDNDQLKYFFYLLHGEAGSRTKTFDGAILVTKSDIEKLINEIISLLKITQVKDYIIKIGVGFDKEIIEKEYTDFQKRQWNDPEKTKEIIIKLNFIHEDYDSGNQIKHSMFIRIARELNRANLLQIFASGGNEKLDELESLTSPLFCRTDHMNDTLSKNLIDTVSKWHKGLKQPRLISASQEFSKKHRIKIALLIHYSYPSIAAFILCYLAFSIQKLGVTNENVMPFYISLIIAGEVIMNFVAGAGQRSANRFFQKITKLSEDDVIFEITRGDDKENSERLNVNRDLFKSAISIFLGSLAQNVLAGLVAAAIIEYIKYRQGI